METLRKLRSILHHYFVLLHLCRGLCPSVDPPASTHTFICIAQLRRHLIALTDGTEAAIESTS